MSGITAVSLFAGIGGFDLALERAGADVVASVEIDPGCRSVLKRQFPESAIFGDVTEVTGDQLRAAGFVPGRGIICGGWPCQGNSVAGRRGGMADPRSGLWRHVVRILAEARPRWFLGENVPGLLSVNGGRDFGTVIRDLDDLGYGVAWRVLDAQWFGVPQRRRRVFIAGCLGDGAAPVQVLLEPESGAGNPAAREAARAGPARASGGGAVSALQGGGRRGHRIDAEGAAGGHLIALPVAWRGRDDGSQLEAGGDGDPMFALRASTGGGTGGMPMVAMAFNPQTGGTAVAIPLDMRNAVRESEAGETAGTSIGDDGDPSFTLSATARAIPGVAAGMAVRRLTPLECERLQGFPGEWTRWLEDGSEQSDSARYRELGNAVAVPVAEWIVRHVAVAEALTAAKGAA